MKKPDGEIVCDICNKSCLVAIGHDQDGKHCHNNVEGKLEFTGCYGSKYDLEHHRCEMCEECYDKVCDFIKSIGGNVRVCECYDWAPGCVLCDEKKIHYGID